MAFLKNILVLLVVQLLLGPAAFSETLKIRLGATVPLSGDLASYGELIANGISLAAEDLKKDGVEAELFIEDTPFSGTGVISSINRHSQCKPGGCDSR